MPRSRALVRDRRVRAGVLIVAGALVLPLAAVAPAQAADRPPLDPNDRASVTAAYQADWLPQGLVDSGWTGSTATCDPGTISDAAQSAALSAINFARGLERLSPVTFDPAWSQQAQAAALLVAANGQLNHTPPSSWACYSAEGAAGTSSSNLGQGYDRERAIAGYLEDDGGNNTLVGHRRWVLNPRAVVMGHGETYGYDALKVFGSGGTSDANPNPAWVPWPAAGYFPTEMEPDGRWSLSGAIGSSWDFSGAAVTVRDQDGTLLPVTAYPQKNGYGADTLVFEVSGLKTEVGLGERDYQVAVSGISGPEGRTDAAYTVRLFDPEATAPAPTPAKQQRTLKAATKITGTAKVGKKLTAVDPLWAPAPAKKTVQWYRSGKPIAHATGHRYTLTKQDRKKKISVVVSTPATSSWAATSSSSKPTKPVR